MTELEQYKSVLADLEKARDPDLVLEGKIWCAINGYHFVQWDGAGIVYKETKNGGVRHAANAVLPRYLSSYDAAIALTKRLLPRHQINLHCYVEDAEASIGSASQPISSARSDAPPLALLTALFRAKIAQMEKADG